MNPASASPAEGGATRRILVWDAPVRLFHGLMVLCFATAYLSAEAEGWRMLHVTAGYTMAGLVAFRLLWGVFGTRHARFSTFVRGPRAVAAYLKSLWARRPQPHVGHNPAGAVAIVLLLGLTVLSALSGWLLYNEIGPHVLEDVHEFSGNALLFVVGVHVAGVIVSSRLHQDKLVRAMVTGYKTGRPADGVRQAWRSVAALMLVVVLSFWAWQWQAAPAPGGLAAQASHADTDRDQDDDD